MKDIWLQLLVLQRVAKQHCCSDEVGGPQTLQGGHYIEQRPRTGTAADLVTSVQVLLPGHEGIVVEDQWISGRQVHVVPWPGDVASLLVI